jgi:hypothetical protein
MSNSLRRVPMLIVAVLFVLSPAAAYAGPPLICHPFDPGPAAVLPWGSGPGWNTPDRTYDVRRLRGDTLRLLTPDMPILARMETLRRATIYAARNRQVADELLTAIVERTTSAPAGPTRTLALFDAGYLIETYRQATHLASGDMLAAPDRPTWAFWRASTRPDGYGLLLQALEAGANPEMEFAASLMKEGRVSEAHRRKAEAGATPGSLLAKNLRLIGPAN